MVANNQPEKPSNPPFTCDSQELARASIGLNKSDKVPLALVLAVFCRKFLTFNRLAVTVASQINQLLSNSVISPRRKLAQKEQMAETQDSSQAMSSARPSLAHDLLVRNETTVPSTNDMPAGNNKPATTQASKTITPEPRLDQLISAAQNTPSTPGLLAPFDWDDFEQRYEKALTDADQQHSAVLKEFDRLAKYVGVWAQASGAHDNERAVKRLQTRQRFVSLSEERVGQNQKHREFGLAR